MASATLSMAAVANCSTPLKSLQPSRKSFNDFYSLKASEFYGTASIPCSRKKADLQVTWRTSAIGSSAQKRSLVVEAKLKVAINGFGRIGRNFLRCWHGRKDSPLDVIVINDTGGIKQASHLLKYDSTLGIFEADVKVAGDDGISVDGKVIKVVSDRNPVNLPWGSKDKGWVSKPLPSLKPKKNYGFKFNFSQNTYPL